MASLDDLIRLIAPADHVFYSLGLVPVLPATQFGATSSASTSAKIFNSGEPKPAGSKAKKIGVRQPRVLAWRECAACGVSFPTHVAWERFCSQRCRSRVWQASYRARLRLERSGANSC